MEKIVEVLVLKNIQEDYAKAYYYIKNGETTLQGKIQKLRYNGSLPGDVDLLKTITANLKVRGDSENIKGTEWKVKKDGMVDFLHGDEETNAGADKLYVLYVLCDYDKLLNFNTDLVNLQYFSLLNLAVSMCGKDQKLKLFFRPMLKIDKENSKYFDEWYYSASQFLYFEIMNNPSTYYACKSENSGMSISPLRPYVDGIWKKFLPLMPIRSYNDINFWLCSMEDIWKESVFKKTNVEGASGKSVWSRLSAEKQESYTKKQKRKYMNESDLFRILNVCKYYLTTIPEIKGNRKTSGIPTKADMQRQLDAWYSSDDFTTRVGDMHLLGFFIYCALEYFSRTEPRKDYSIIDEGKLIEKLSNATQMAEGIMQLVENVVSHAQFHKGYFSFRIHTLERNELKDYLRNKYNKYFDENRMKLIGEEGKKHFLEVQVMDFSEIGLVENYQKNLRKRAKKHYGDEKRIPQNVEQIINTVQFKQLLSQRKVYNSEYDFLNEKYYLVHHYGLKLFVSLIRTIDGYFKVCSLDQQQNISYDSEGLEQEEKGYIPGTQYQILFPSEYPEKQENTSLNTEIDYIKYLNNNFVTRNVAWKYSRQFFETSVVQWMEKKYSWQQAKEKTIEEIAQNFRGEGDNQISQDVARDTLEIMIFNAHEIELSSIEYFCKACIIWILDNYSELEEKRIEQIIPIAIINCTAEHFIGIVRMFSVFYSKQESVNVMEKIQIYLVGENVGEEFILTGKSFQDALAAAEKLAFTRGIQYYNILSSLHFSSEPIGTGVVDLIPFDMEIRYEDGKTPFDRGVLEVLENDIRDEKFGCKIRDAHMRLGSKIHIKDFYEAELLFHNNYYTSRFAYQILKELEKNEKWDCHKPLIIVGYETYAEMLLTEMVTLIKNRLESKNIENEHINYIYYENKSASFRVPENNVEEWMCVDTQFVIVVPINSTLTTHDKLIANLKKFMPNHGEPNVIEKIAIVLIRDNAAEQQDQCSDLEKQFWEEIVIPNGELPYIITKQLSGCEKHTVKFLLTLQTTWYSPLGCPWCFPKINNLKEEHPLIETNKASVVPMQKINLKAKRNDSDLEMSKDEEENINRVANLSQYLIYQHIVRNNNHHMFYFETEKYMKNERNSIGKWLQGEEVQKAFCKKEGLVFDILVAPLHYSNTVFVEEVNRQVFRGASLVLHFDVEKEYRENISTKFSNIKILYNNLKNSEKKNCMIRFHYVDDTITSGNTFYRMRSVIRSIFPQKVFLDSANEDVNTSKSNVEIRLFDSVFLLLNRSSSLTKYNYINDATRYFAYVDLYVSSMRNHEDACVLCKYVDDAKKLQADSAFFDLMKYWGKKIKRHEIRRVIDIPLNRDDDVKKERAMRRLICSHKAALWLKKVRNICCENEEQEIDAIRNVIIHRMFLETKEIDFEILISYIKVLSRPFIIFDRLTKRAVFALLIEMFDIILEANQSVSREEDQFHRGIGKYNLQRIPKMQKKECQCAYELLLTLMKRSAAMGSTYVIRRQNMERIIDYYRKIKEKDPAVDAGNTFYERYLAIVKKNVGLSSDEMKCVYLEYLLIYGREPEEESPEEVGACGEGLLEDPFYQKLFIENNRVLIETLKDLKKDFGNLDSISEEGFIDKINQSYYYLNFRQILYYYDMVVLDNSKKDDYHISKFVCDDLDFDAIKAFIEMESLINESYSDEITERYNKIREVVKRISRAEAVNIYVCKKDITEVQDRLIDVYSLTGKEDDRREKLSIPSLEDRKINMGTYLWIEEQENKAYRVIAIVKGKGKGESLLFEFCFQLERKAVLISLKLFFVYWSQMLDYIEKDIKNNLISKWLEGVDFKFQISKSRAKDHMDDDILYNQMKGLMKKYKDIGESITGLSYDAKELYTDETADFLMVIVNMYIARFNTRILTIDKESLQYYNGKMRFCEIYQNYLKIMLQILKEKSHRKFNINADWEKMGERTVTYHMQSLNMKRRREALAKRDEEGECKDVGNKEDKTKKELSCTPLHHHLAVIICECILSAAKHGKNEGDDNGVDISITEKGDDMCIKNRIEKGSGEKIQTEINRAKERKGDGISVVTIYEYFQHFYSGSGREVKYNVNDESFEVVLPIFARRREKK